jgi:hypothetical protein
MTRRLTSMLLLPLLLGPVLLAQGCNRPVDALNATRSSIAFERETTPQTISVWSNNPSVGEIQVEAVASDNWFTVDPLQATLPAAESPNQDPANISRQFKVTLNLNQLAVGLNEGELVFLAPGIVPLVIPVSAIGTRPNNGDALNIINPEVRYREPYIVDFNFALRDEDDEAVVAEPAMFDLEAQEDSEALPVGSGLQLRRGAAKLLKTELVLDYTLSLQQTAGAIDAMELAAKNILLPAFNPDAQVGITEFHAENLDAARVQTFTTNRNLLRNRIDVIQEEFVQGFSSFAAIFDALIFAAEQFDGGDVEQEDRYIVLFSDGNDDSSIADINDVYDAMRVRNISIYTVGVGANTDDFTLEQLALETGGKFIPADTVAELDDSFTAIVRDLESQYTVRWASPSRGSAPVFPQFTLDLNGDEATYQAPDPLIPSTVAGNVLEGQLRIVPSDDELNRTAFLRADYIPRFINELVFQVSSSVGYTVDLVDTADDGLAGTWSLSITDNPENMTTRIALTSDGSPLPFAGFGPILRFDFDAIIGDEVPFDVFFVNNAVYANGQSFVVEGYENVLP